MGLFRERLLGTKEKMGYILLFWQRKKLKQGDVETGIEDAKLMKIPFSGHMF
jgi:hypothetical protein